jgi:hypothetical protein
MGAVPKITAALVVLICPAALIWLGAKRNVGLHKQSKIG